MTFSALMTIAVTFLVATHSPPETYSPSDRAEFIDDCQEGREIQASRCGCVFDQIRARVPRDEYEDANRTRNVETWSLRLREAIAAGLECC